jgi:hypothetical protein
MISPETTLHRRARLAYEVGRLWCAAPLVVASLALGVSTVACECCGTGSLGPASVLALVAGGCAFRSSALGRSAWFGLCAGLPGLLLPTLAQSFDHGCTPGGGCEWLALACIGGGAAVGLALGLHAASLPRPRSLRAVAASVVALLVASLACVPAGGVAMAALLCGLAAGAAPVVAWRRA